MTTYSSWYHVKIIVVAREYNDNQRQFKRHESVFGKENTLPKVAELISEVILKIAVRDPDNGFSPFQPIMTLEKVHWEVYNLMRKLIHSGSNDLLKEGAPPVCFMAGLPLESIDKALHIYHEMRNKEC